MNDQEEFNLRQLHRARTRDFRTKHKQQREVKKIIEKVQNIFRDNGEEFEIVDEVKLVTKPGEIPNFPIIIFMAAIIKDLLDIPQELTIVGIIFTTILSLILGAVLFIWTIKKTNGGWWKKK